MSDPGSSSRNSSRSRSRGPRRPRRRNPRPLRAVALLTLIAACLACVLVLLPPRDAGESGERSARGAVQSPAERSAPGGVPAEQPPVREPAEQPPRTAPPAAAAPRERLVRAGRLAVVIDDVGYNLENLEPFLSSRLDLSRAVLPGLPHSREAARRIRAAGKELLLHLPMEARNGADPGPMAVLTTMDDEEVRRLLAASLEEVPAAGVNNHMGSAATADERIMRVVLGYLKSRGLFFLDSRTTPETVVLPVAESLAAPALKRDVFLDNDPAPEAIRSQLGQGLELAEQRGQAVLIGHVHNPHIAQLLEAALPEMERRGLQVVRAGALGAPEARRP